MIPAPIPLNEKLRQLSVDELGLDSLWSELCFERATRLVTSALQVPIAAFSVITRDRQVFKASLGMDTYSTTRSVSFCGYTILSNEVMVVPDASRDDRFHDNPLVTESPGIRFYIGAPVRAPSGAAVGAVCGVDRKPRDVDDGQRVLIGGIARMLESELLLRSMQVRDPLTGTYARGSFSALAERSWRRARCLGLGSGLIMLAVDRYLSYMRSSGRYGTDQILQRVGQCIQETCGSGDRILGRMNDDRFVLFMTHNDRGEVLKMADGIRCNIGKLGVIKDSMVSRPITASVGIATQDEGGTAGRSFMDLLDRAYTSLTRAKANGGNCVAGAP